MKISFVLTMYSLPVAVVTAGLYLLTLTAGL